MCAKGLCPLFGERVTHRPPAQNCLPCDALHFVLVHEDTKMDSNALCLLALKVKWLSIVLQWSFFSFLSYKQKSLTMNPLFDVSKMHVLVGWLKGGGISGTVGELRLGSQELTLWDATKVDAISKQLRSWRTRAWQPSQNVPRGGWCLWAWVVFFG